MFGYFRFYNQYASYDMQKVYKNYYCATCFALEQHYGQLSRFLLSYDVTLLAIMLSLHKNSKCEPLKCLGNCSTKCTMFEDEQWKKIAAINILLSAEKFDDDINDDKSVSAKVLKTVFSKPIKKAKQDFPEIDKIIIENYKQILVAESNNLSVLQIGDVFASMMLKIMVSAFGCKEREQLYITEISRWLYFIDALDDYDKDVKKHRFNPLVIPGVNYNEYVNLHTNEIQIIISDLYKNFSTIISHFDSKDEETRILVGLIHNTIPSVTSRILCGKRLPSLLHKKNGNVWKGASV